MSISINLLPGIEKRKERLLVAEMFSIILILFGLAAGGLFLYGSFLIASNEIVKNDIAQVDLELNSIDQEIQKFTPIIEQSRQLRSQIKAISLILEKQNHWANFLTALAQATPSQGIKYVHFTAEDTGRFILAGIADSSRDFSILTDSLKQAWRQEPYTLTEKDTLASLAGKNKIKSQNILLANQVQQENDLLALQEIVLPFPLFKQVNIVQAVINTDENAYREVEKNVEFTYEIELTDQALQY